MLFSAAIFVALGWLCARLSLFEAVGASILDLSLIHDKVAFDSSTRGTHALHLHWWQPSIHPLTRRSFHREQVLVSCVFAILASAFALLVWFFDELVRSDASAELRVRPPSALSSSSSSSTSSTLAPPSSAATTTVFAAAAASAAASAAAAAAPTTSASLLPFSPAVDHSGDVGGGSSHGATGTAGHGSASAAAATAMPAPVMGHMHALAAPRRTQSTSSFSRYSPLS
jgi:hypothetical protein